MSPLEPLPETRVAIEGFGPFLDEDLLEVMLEAGEQVRGVVPSLVGLSLGFVHEGLTFTVQATSEEIAALDAVQYLDGGPCADIVDDDEDAGSEGTDDADDGETHELAHGDAQAGGTYVDGDLATAFHHGDALAEGHWQMFAQATAAAGIRSTLTLPVLSGAQVIGSVTLYAAAAHAFDGHHEAVATICRAWAPGAVTNADLSFETRQAAARAPQLLHEQAVITRASGILMQRRGIDLDEARAAIRDVAAQSGVSEYDVALVYVRSAEDLED